MSNNRTGQNNNWDDDLDIQEDGYNTEQTRPRRRRVPPEQAYQPPQRRARPTTESGQSPSQSQRSWQASDYSQTERPQSPQRQPSPQRSQQPRPTKNLRYTRDFAGEAEEYEENRPSRRAYSDTWQADQSRTDRLDRTRQQRPADEYDVPSSPQPRRNTDSQMRQARPRPRSVSQRVPPRQRRVWPWLLFGCLGGIVLVVLGVGIAAYLAVRSASGGGIGIGGIGGTRTYTQNNSQPVPLASITQLQIHNQIGNVAITVDPNATTPTVSTTKSVKASSQSDANNQFNSIAVQIDPPGTPPTTLAVSASVSDNSGLFGTHNNSVDIVITLPQSVNSSGTPVVLNGGGPTSNITSVGNVTISGLNGMLNVKNDIGNITVQHALLSPGSTLETGTGNVTFNGTLDTSSGSSSNQSIYTVQSEAGNLDVTLPANINVTLDAYTNSGNITTDFNLSQIKQSDGSYNGPMIYGTQPHALLKLHVSTGNVTLRKG